VLEQFALQTGAGTSKKILLVMDRAGWHRSDKVVLPSGIYVEYLPPYSPEQQRTERLWSVADQPLVNKSFDKIQDGSLVIRVISNAYWNGERKRNLFK
jgi:transposase